VQESKCPSQRLDVAPDLLQRAQPIRFCSCLDLVEQRGDGDPLLLGAQQPAAQDCPAPFLQEASGLAIVLRGP
jgi:hypothetical protein